MTDSNIKDIIAEITDNTKPLLNSTLADLSQITPADMHFMKQVLENIEVDRRRLIATRLVEIAHDNVELNFDIIFKHFLNDRDAEVKKQAIDGLWENEDPLLIQTFSRMLQQDTSNDVQASAALALGRFVLLSELEEIRPQYKEILSRILLATIEDTGKSIEVRRRALEAIAPLSIPQVKETIRKAYESKDERLIISAIYAMGRTCEDLWLPVLFKELGNADAEIRYEAAGACGEIGAKEAISHLMEIVNDPDIEVRMSIIQALGKIGSSEAKKCLQRIADDPNEAIKDAVTQALTDIDTQLDLTLFTTPASGHHHYERREN